MQVVQEDGGAIRDQTRGDGIQDEAQGFESDRPESGGTPQLAEDHRGDGLLSIDGEAGRTDRPSRATAPATSASAPPGTREAYALPCRPVTPGPPPRRRLGGQQDTRSRVAGYSRSLCVGWPFVQKDGLQGCDQRRKVLGYGIPDLVEIQVEVRVD